MGTIFANLVVTTIIVLTKKLVKVVWQVLSAFREMIYLFYLDFEEVQGFQIK